MVNHQSSIGKMSLARPRRAFVTLLLLALTLVPRADAADKPRARLLGIPFDGVPGALDAITDVAGVEVGFTTLIAGEGALKVGEGPVRTGVTAILPRGHRDTLDHPVFAGDVQPQRQRRDDRHGLGGRRRLPRRAGRAHEHAQRRHGAGRGHQMARRPGRARRDRLLVEPAGGGGDLRRLPQRRERLPRQGRARFPRARQRAAPGRWPRAASAAARG